jgi:hypothetical protein
MNMEARVGVTYGGEYGELPDTVNFDATDGDIRAMIAEAVHTGGIPGIPAAPAADFRDYVLDRFASNDARPYNLIQIRPKTPFGA